jgi:hypothetical protein
VKGVEMPKRSSIVVGLLLLAVFVPSDTPTRLPALGAASASAEELSYRTEEPPERIGSAAGEERITSAGLMRELVFLASPELEGRESASRGARVAARYLALRFAQAGLKALGPSYARLDAAAPSFYQPFNIIRFRWDVDASALQLRRNTPSESAHTFKLGNDFFPWSYSGDIEVTAPVVFAGYGITAPELGYDDYAGVDVRGRMVLVFDHEPQETLEDSRWGGRAHTREAAMEVKARTAHAHGAVALLVMPEPVLEHKDIWTLFGPWLSLAKTMENQVLEEPEVRIPILAVKRHVGRALVQTAGHEPDAVQERIETTERPQSFLIPDIVASLRLRAKESDSDTTANVIGLLQGSDSTLKSEAVIVGAHYDHTGTREGAVFLGADDDASGIAGLLEMARAMSSAGRRPRRSVLFAAWGAEEKGLLGSEFYASKPLIPLSKTAAMIQLDMIGRDEAPTNADELRRLGDRDSRNSVHLLGPAFAPELRTLVEELNEGLGLVLDYRLDRDIEQSLFQRSDQWPFAMRGVPVLFFFTGLHPDYHTPADSAIKINSHKMERVVRLAYRSVWAIADADKRPEFTPIPVPAPRSGRHDQK